MVKKFEYFINLDERGEFNADVRNEKGKTVFEFSGFDIFEDGFMKNKHDISGLRDYLIDLKIMKLTDSLTCENENVPALRTNRFR